MRYKYENVENVVAKKDFEVFTHDEIDVAIYEKDMELYLEMT